MTKKQLTATNANGCEGPQDLIDTLSSPYFILILAFGLFAIMIMQSLWITVSGLYFNHAYEAIVIPYTVYFIFNLYHYSQGLRINQTKAFFMFVSFINLFAPALYLLMTKQVDFHGMIFDEFNPNLQHLPFAHLLPYLALLALFVPYKDFLVKK